MASCQSPYGIMKKNWIKRNLSWLWMVSLCLCIAVVAAGPAEAAAHQPSATPAVSSPDQTRNWHDDGLGISLSLPAGFSLTTPPRPEIHLAAVQPEGRLCIQISEEKQNQPVPPGRQKAYLKKSWQAYERILKKDPAIRDIHTGMTHIGTHQAASLTYTQRFYLGNQIIDLYTERYLLLSGSSLYILTLTADDSTKDLYLSSMQQCLQTFSTY